MQLNIGKEMTHKLWVIIMSHMWCWKNATGECIGGQIKQKKINFRNWNWNYFNEIRTHICFVYRKQIDSSVYGGVPLGSQCGSLIFSEKFSCMKYRTKFVLQMFTPKKVNKLFSALWAFWIFLKTKNKNFLSEKSVEKAFLFWFVTI